MSDNEKKLIYDNAKERLESSLSSTESFINALNELKEIEDYEDSKALIEKYSKILEERLEEEKIRNRRRKSGRIIQSVLLFCGALIVLLVLFVVVLYVRARF